MYCSYTPFYFHLRFKDAINRTVVPIFCLAMELADETKQSKLTRVLTLWETNAYVPEDVLKDMKETEDRNAFMEKWREDQSKVRFYKTLL